MLPNRNLNYKSACWVFCVSVIHKTLTWITGSFDVHMQSFLCVCIRTGVGHTDSESAHHFLLRKTLKVFSCAPGGVSNLESSDLVSDALPNEPP